jgi:hypothetical protein
MHYFAHIKVSGPVVLDKLLGLVIPDEFIKP